MGAPRIASLHLPVAKAPPTAQDPCDILPPKSFISAQRFASVRQEPSGLDQQCLSVGAFDGSLRSGEPRSGHSKPNALAIALSSVLQVSSLYSGRLRVDLALEGRGYVAQVGLVRVVVERHQPKLGVSGLDDETSCTSRACCATE